MGYETVLLDTIDGLRLVGDFVLPPSPWGGAVVAHPHPRYGGDRHHPVVEAVHEALGAAGLASVRFDFRGVGGSEGAYGDGVDERLDVLAALEAVLPLAGDGPVVLAGYSFGALVTLEVTDPRVSGWLAVAPPLGLGGAGAPLAAADHRPKHLAVPEHDQFCPPERVAEQCAGWTATSWTAVPMADHFLAGRAAAVAEVAVSFARSLR